MRMLARTIALGVALSVSPDASAQAVEGAAATVDVRPPTISVAPWDQSAESRVILHNSGKVDITGATLSVFSNDGIAAKIDPSPSPKVSPGDSFAWRVPVDVTGARFPGNLELDISFTAAGERRQRHVYQSLKFTALEGAVAEKPIEVTLSGSFDAINDTRPGRGYVVVVNNLDVPATVTDIRVQTSDPDSFGKDANFDVNSKKSVPFADFDVPARSSRSQFIELRASPSVATGKHRIVLAVDAEWTRHGRKQSRTLLVGQDVTLGVFFETELLRVLGVPSFLVLPGCLFLYTIQVLLKFKVGGDNRPTQFPELSSTAPEFWVIAISWSGVFAWAYARLTGTDYLSRYGAADLRNVWLISIALGVLLYAALVGFNRARTKDLPKTTDDEMTTLVKMGARGLMVRVPTADVTFKNATLKAFIINESPNGPSWAAPPIGLKWTGDAKTLTAKTQVINLMNAGSAADLAQTLSANAKSVQVEWAVAGSLQSPTQIPIADIKRTGEEPMVRML